MTKTMDYQEAQQKWERLKYLCDPATPECVGPFKGMCCGKVYRQGICSFGLGATSIPADPPDYLKAAREVSGQ